jgi:hypothetical protein
MSMTGESSDISARTWRIVGGDPELLSGLTLLAVIS